MDFKAEIVNKDVQSWMPRGLPSGEDWLRVTRNLEHLKEVSIDHVVDDVPFGLLVVLRVEM